MTSSNWVYATHPAATAPKHTKNLLRARQQVRSSDAPSGTLERYPRALSLLSRAYSADEFAAFTGFSSHGRCWVRTSDLLLVRQAL